MIRRLTGKDEEEELKRKGQRERKQKAEIRIKEAEIKKKLKKQEWLPKTPLRKRKFVVQYLNLLKILLSLL